MRLVLNLQSIKSPTDSLEQRSLTTTVHTTYQDDGLIGSHRQIQVKTQISLIVLDFDSLDNHNLFFTLRSSFLVHYLIREIASAIIFSVSSSFISILSTLTA